MDQKQKAHYLVNKAIKHGEILLPDTCELCETTYIKDGLGHYKIVCHHHNGYEDNYIFDVWYICRTCNSKLRGCHDGSLTKEEARKLVTNYLSTKQVAEQIGTYPDMIVNRIKAGWFPNAARLSDIIGESGEKRNWWLIPVEDVRQYIKANSIKQGDTMTKKGQRGGRRTPPGGRPKGSGTKPESEKAKRFTIRLYRGEAEALQLLVDLGYGKDKTEVIRNAIREIIGKFTEAELELIRKYPPRQNKP